MFTDDELLPISALQHLEYCPRRCALVHIEGLWADNVQTAEGNNLHKKAHEAASENNDGVRIARGLRLASSKLGLYGIADVVEFQPTDSTDERTIRLPDSDQRWIMFPIEYKRGRRKPEMAYSVQLCAQALCLEEMLGGFIPVGALYHGQSRRHQIIPFDDPLRTRTWNRIGELHRLIASGKTPPAVFGPKCKFCSLHEKCMPKLTPSQSAAGYATRMIASLLEHAAEDGVERSDDNDLE